MAITFQPKTEKELKEANLIADKSICDFEILEATDKLSKASNQMIELKLKVYRDDGTFIYVNDYLLASMEFKLRHAADSTGNIAKYNAGKLEASDFSGKAGKLRVGIQKGEAAGNVDENGEPEFYPDKNTVRDYIKGGVAVTNAPAKPIDDTIPF